MLSSLEVSKNKTKTQESRSYSTLNGINSVHSLLLTDDTLITLQWPCLDCINSEPTVCCEYKKRTSYDQDDIVNPTTVNYIESESESVHTDASEHTWG